MATVTAIIDGCGSIGAAMQGYLVGWIASEYGWSKVFVFLMEIRERKSDTERGEEFLDFDAVVEVFDARRAA